MPGLLQLFYEMTQACELSMYISSSGFSELVVFQAKMVNEVVVYAIALVVILIIKITFWLVYWLYVRPRMIRRRLERQQAARQVLIIQQQQQQPYPGSNYSTVQPFSYETVYPAPAAAPRPDVPPPTYESAVKTPPIEN